jgi:hypothetical protein
MSEYQQIGWSRVAIASRLSSPTPTAASYSQMLQNLRPALREILAGWIVCLAIAAGCFGGLAAAGAVRDGWTTASISPDRPAAVASATDRAVYAGRDGKC